MPNLVGIGNSQVPTNAMLGGLAYQDSVGEIDIEKIKARTSDTATDVFVYDTRKDSDGGAWRHRTQNTSWYNEGVSPTRGARKEFPSVAVIVCFTSGLIIYDGDDPNLPMWMEWTTTNGLYMLRGPSSGKIAAMNGIIAVTNASTYGGVVLIYFISDTSRSYRQLNSSNNSEGHWMGNGIATRNDFSGKNYSNSAGGRVLPTLIDENTRDVAMTVLPNAPIDPATGLPRPTIAVATIGGSCIIRDDDETVIPYTTIATQNIDIHPDGFMLDGITGAVNDNFSLFDINNRTRVTAYDARASVSAYPLYLNQGSGDCKFEGSGNEIAIAQTLGLLRIEEVIDDYASGLQNRTTSSYNTGWMLGNTQGAFLSDIDTTFTSAGIAVTGTEYVTNGNFASGLSGWTAQVNTGGSITVNGSSQVVITSQDASNRTELQQTVVVPKGVDLIYSFDLISGSIYNGGAASNNLGAGTHQWTFNIPGTGSQTINLWFTPPGWSGSGTLDNISIRTAEQDRGPYGRVNSGSGDSTQRHGLEHHGTINKRRVAVGAELVGYNFPAATSYFSQPYTSEIGNIGSDPFCVMGWFYNTPRGVTFFDIASSASPRFFVAQLYNSDNFWIYMNTGSGGASWYPISGGGVENEARWQFIAVKRVGTRLSYSYNGADFVSQINAGWGGDLSSSSAPHPFVTLGQNYTHGSAHFGSNGMMSLWKFSASVPTNEQIKKIYNDEKLLFQENAKCSLYGTSDDVKALAYDDKTDVLHVGTSGGRSDFRGLKRINNTTTAVTTAISASNGLVAEQ